MHSYETTKTIVFVPIWKKNPMNFIWLVIISGPFGQYSMSNWVIRANDSAIIILCYYLSGTAKPMIPQKSYQQWTRFLVSGWTTHFGCTDFIFWRLCGNRGGDGYSGRSGYSLSIWYSDGRASFHHHYPPPPPPPFPHTHTYTTSHLKPCIFTFFSLCISIIPSEMCEIKSIFIFQWNGNERVDPRMEMKINGKWKDTHKKM